MNEIRIIDNNFDKNIYNEKAIHPLQSWQWGEARRAMGIKVVRVGEFNGVYLKDVYQFTIHKIPPNFWKIGYLPRSKFPSKPVLQFLFDYGKKNNIIFIKIEPYQQKSKMLIGNQVLTKSPHPLFPNWTQILDLSKSEDELLNNMKSKTRYNIRLAKKKGVLIKEESSNQGFEIFAKLYFETCKRQKYFGHNLFYHQKVWDFLKDEIAHILIAYYNNTPVAAYELFYFNKVCYYTYGGSSLLHRNTMAANLLMWEAIRLGKRLGAEKFDMWGSLPPNYVPNHPWAGFTRFKEGYGGDFIEMAGSFDLVINPFFYQVYNFLHRFREIYLKIRR